eukprot:m.234251 g.234251  ORF g.234251 m.234251 type:complete len:456 (-) comp15254_c0_seq2:147-1514(-)
MKLTSPLALATILGVLCVAQVNSLCVETSVNCKNGRDLLTYESKSRKWASFANRLSSRLADKCSLGSLIDSSADLDATSKTTFAMFASQQEFDAYSACVESVHPKSKRCKLVSAEVVSDSVCSGLDVITTTTTATTTTDSCQALPDNTGESIEFLYDVVSPFDTFSSSQYLRVCFDIEHDDATDLIVSVSCPNDAVQSTVVEHVRSEEGLALSGRYCLDSRGTSSIWVKQLPHLPTQALHIVATPFQSGCSNNRAWKVTIQDADEHRTGCVENVVVTVYDPTVTTAIPYTTPTGTCTPLPEDGTSIDLEYEISDVFGQYNDYNDYRLIFCFLLEHEDSRDISVTLTCPYGDASEEVVAVGTTLADGVTAMPRAKYCISNFFEARDVWVPSKPDENPSAKYIDSLWFDYDIDNFNKCSHNGIWTVSIKDNIANRAGCVGPADGDIVSTTSQPLDSP